LSCPPYEEAEAYVDYRKYIFIRLLMDKFKHAM
jgi:hypothetical protein